MNDITLGASPILTVATYGTIAARTRREVACPANTPPIRLRAATLRSSMLLRIEPVTSRAMTTSASSVPVVATDRTPYSMTSRPNMPMKFDGRPPTEVSVTDERSSEIVIV